MKKKTKKSTNDFPMGKIKFIKDDLPSPKELAKSFKTKKITIDIEAEILSFFQEEAKKSGAKYQRLIREVLKEYAKRFKNVS